MHAYLESLLKFSDVEQEMISVLYCEMENIHYEKLMKAFPKINWVKEEKFEKDLKSEIENAGEYIMFGCDDVVFTGKFSVNKAAEYLEKNPQVFGFSMRLGENIKPYPKNLSKDENVFEWRWEGCKEQHYNYPWELDCTLYRKEDVLKLTMQEENPIKNPNYYEAMITPDNREKRIPRKNMASNKCGKAVVITVNRVQDTHQNDFDDSMRTDIFSLDRLYNNENNTLDIDKISSMDNSMIHVGAEYFVLRKAAEGYSSKRLVKKKVKAVIERMTRFPRRMYRRIERICYEKGKYSDCLNILSTEDTLKLMETEKFCFLRYGDGEIAIMKGESIPFQKYDEKLAKRLIKLLRVDRKGLKIGIPYYYMHPMQNLNGFVSNFAKSLSAQRKFLRKYCRKDIIYIDTAITQVYQTYQQYDFNDYYNRMQNLLKNRDITIICGEGILDRLEYKAFDVCKTVEFVTAPSMNAYETYDVLLKKALKIDKKRLVCIMLGPTAKVLVCDLYKKGYQAWDMGHYFKDYDSYMRKRPRTEAEIIQFYKPD